MHTHVRVYTHTYSLSHTFRMQTHTGAVYLVHTRPQARICARKCACAPHTPHTPHRLLADLRSQLHAERLRRESLEALLDESRRQGLQLTMALSDARALHDNAPRPSTRHRGARGGLQGVRLRPACWLLAAGLLATLCSGGAIAHTTG